MEKQTIPGLDPAIEALVTSISIDTDQHSVTIFTNKGSLKIKHFDECCECVWLIHQPVLEDRYFIGEPLREIWELSHECHGNNSDCTNTVIDIQIGFDWFQFIWHGESNGYYSTGVDFTWTPLKQ